MKKKKNRRGWPLTTKAHPERINGSLSKMTQKEFTFYRKLGQNLRKCRVKRKLSQIQVAKRLKIHRMTLIRYEGGKVQIPAYVLERFGEVYGFMFSFGHLH